MKEKLFIKIGTILALLLSIVIFTDISPNYNLQEVSAAGSGVSKIMLKVNEGTVSCTGWYGMLNMGAVDAAFSGSVVSGAYTPVNSRECIDTRGSGSIDWSLKIYLTGNLYTSLHTGTIATGNARICLTGGLNLLNGVVGATTGTTITTCPTIMRFSGGTMDIMYKHLGGTGLINKIGTTPKIGVDVPPSQGPGVYTGHLSIDAPNL